VTNPTKDNRKRRYKMKIKKKEFEIEISVSELKELLYDGYINEALKKAERYLKPEENLEGYLIEAKNIIDEEDDVIVLWSKLRMNMPKGSKHAFSKEALKKLKTQMDNEFLNFQKCLLEDNVYFEEEENLSSIFRYIEKFMY
jgi:hypothetical protein